MDKENGNFVYWICLLLGTGVLLAYNLLITCADYFTMKFPDHPHIMFYIVPMSAFPQLLCSMLMIAYGEKYSFSIRIIPSFIFSALALCVVPIAVHQLSQRIAFVIVLCMSAFLGSTTAVLQVSVVGYINHLPSKYIQISFAGQACSGIVACVVRVITKLYDVYGSITVEHAGLIYFVTGGVFDVICAIAFAYVARSAFTHFWLRHQGEHHIEHIVPLINETPSIVSEVSLVGAAADNNNNNNAAAAVVRWENLERAVSYRSVLKKIWKLALALFLVFFITLLSYPGLLVGIESQYESIQAHTWMPVILTTEYNIGDYIGRQFLVSWLSNVCSWNEHSLWKASVLRICLYPVFIVLFLGYCRFDVVAYTMTALLSTTNGYMSALCFIKAPESVQPFEQQKCAAIMSFALILGITCGSYTALAVTPLL